LPDIHRLGILTLLNLVNVNTHHPAHMQTYPSIKVNFKTQVLVEELGDEAVLLNSDSEHYYGLDAIALRFWQLLSKHGNTEDTVAEFISEYDVDEQTAHKDLAKLIVDLEKAELLEICQA